MLSIKQIYQPIFLIWLIISSCNPTKLDIAYNIEAKGQFIVNNSIKIRQATAPDPVWISLWSKPVKNLSDSNTLLAKKYLGPGKHHNIKLSITDTATILDRNLTSFEVMMHDDSGVAKRFDYRTDPSLDKPINISDRAVSESFTALYIDSNADSYIEVEDQEMERNSINILQVYANEPSVIVLHPDQGNLPKPPVILGVTKLEQGISNNVKIDIFPEESVECGELLWAMLHVRSVSDDQPFDIDLPVITEPFVVQCN